MIVFSPLAGRFAFVSVLLFGGCLGRAQAASFVVTNTTDATGSCGASSCSLRQAITSANADPASADTITFADSVRGTITLSATDADTTDGTSAFVLDGNVTIQGPGANLLTLQRSTSGTAFRLFQVPAGVSAQISGLTLSKGSTGAGQVGGAFLNRGTLGLTGCVVTGNTAAAYGGAIYNAGTLSVQNSTIAANVASGYGTSGGIDNGGGTGAPVGTVTLVNSTISGNTASSTAGRGSGGGLWTGNGATISNCTITGNSAGNGASGILAVGGTVRLSNTIVAANQSNSTLPDVVVAGGAFASSGYNLIGNVGAVTAFTGSGDQKGSSSVLNPKLGTLQNNGGPTTTHALLTGSPAINAGDPAFDVTTLATDQRGAGYDRVGNGRLDIGAYEVPSDVPVITSVTVTPGSPRTNETLTAQVQASASNLSYTYQWKKNNTAIDGATASTLDLSQAGNGDKGDQITVTVVARSGSVSSAPVTSAAVTVANSAPVVSGVSITPSTPTTNSVLTASIDTQADADNDALTVTYQWKKNGTAIEGATASTLDLSQAGNGDAGESISVVVTVSDGTASASAESGVVTVGSDAPIISSVSIAPLAPTTKDLLSATVVGSSDNLSYTYQWNKNGTAIEGATSATLDLSVAGNGDKGDAISVTVVASDGTQSSAPLTSEAVTVVNSAPSVEGVAISPAAPSTSSTLSVESLVLTDADNDTLTTTYQWKKNGEPISGATGATLDLSVADNGDAGDKLSVSVTVSDGTTSTSLESTSVTVANLAPVVTSVAITPASATTNSLLSATVKANDGDGETLTYSYQWNKNGEPISGATGPTLDLSKAGNGDKGDVITLTVVANDGTQGSEPVTSAGVTVRNSAPALGGITIEPSTPFTNTLLKGTPINATDLDGDTLTYSYQWSRNGVAISGATSATLDLSKVGNGDKGDNIALQITASDGTSVATRSASVSVRNTVPVMTSVKLDKSAPRTDDPITATVVGTDLDGDALTYVYTWTRLRAGRTSTIRTLTTTQRTDTLPTVGESVIVGDVITVSVVAKDGQGTSTALTQSVTIANTPISVVIVNYTPVSPKTNDSIVINVRPTDVDRNKPTFTYTWTKKTRAGQTSTVLTTTSTSTNVKLDLSKVGNGNKGDVITFTVTASDGSSTASASRAFTLINTVPVLTRLSLSPTKPTTKGKVTASFAANDPDATDGVDTTSYVYKWRIGTRLLSSEKTPVLDLSKYNYVKAGDSVSLELRASDGNSLSEAKTAAVTVVAPPADASSAPGA